MRSWCISLSVVEWGGWAVSPGAVGAVGAVGAMGAGRGEGGCPVLISSAGMPTSVVQEVGLGPCAPCSFWNCPGNAYPCLSQGLAQVWVKVYLDINLESPFWFPCGEWAEATGKRPECEFPPPGYPGKCCCRDGPRMHKGPTELAEGSSAPIPIPAIGANGECPLCGRFHGDTPCPSPFGLLLLGGYNQ